MKLSLFLLVLMVSSIAIVSGSTFVIIDDLVKSEKESTLDLLQRNSIDFSRLISLDLNERISDVELLSSPNSPLLSTMLTLDEKRDYLLLFITNYPDYESVSVYDKDGQKIIDTRNLGIGTNISKSLVFQQTVENLSYYDPYPLDVNSLERSAISNVLPVLRFSSSLYTVDGEFTGIVIANYSVFSLFQTLLEFSDPHFQYELLSHDGVNIANSKNHEVLAHDMHLNLIPNTATVYDNWIISTSTLPEVGRYLENPDLLVIVKIDQNMAFQEINSQQQFLQIITLSTLIGFILVMLYVAKKLDSDLLHIQSVLQNIAAGKKFITKNLLFKETQSFQSQLRLTDEILTGEKISNKQTAKINIDIQNVIKNVANGKFDLKCTREFNQPFSESQIIINTMVDQLNLFSSEVTRVAKEVGVDGILGGQANVPGVQGQWKELTDTVNELENNLTTQVREIANVTTAVAKGDLSQKVTADVKGEVLELKETINTMVDQLNLFSSEVTRVAKEVGVDGILGGQANVPGVQGQWKELTDTVNELENNLTTQVREIANVTASMITGNFDKKVTVSGKGEVRKLQLNINQSVDQLSRVEYDRSEFSAMITHELKTPLVPINGYCQMLLKEKLGKLTNDQKDAVQEISTASDSLLNLIQNILSAQQSDSGRNILNLTRISSSKILDESFTKLLPLMVEKNIKFEQFPLSETLVLADHGKLIEIMTNLVQNAVDFVPQNSGKISISCTKDDDGALFSVKDNGIGISLEQQKKLFTKFYQVDTSATRKHGGTGLGLSICKGFVESMGGKIWVESDKGKGSTFFFTIPKAN
jgi:signal transduction histidine kinase